MKVSGSLKNLIKKIIWIKNQNLEATVEKEMLDALRTSNPVNYHDAMNKHMREPWSRRLNVSTTSS